MRVRPDWIVIAVAFFAMSCSGGGCGGCGGMEPIPGGFPAAKRHGNAGQVRLSQSGLATLTADPAALVSSLLGSSGPLSFNIPGSCGADPQICCVNNMVTPTCGPLNIDLTQQAGDDPRLVLAPQAGKSTLNVTVRARLKTAMPIHIHETISCDAAIDTTKGSNKDVEIIVPIAFAQDGTAGTTRINPGDITINRLETADITLSGDFTCTLAGFGLSFLLDTLKSTIADQIKSAIGDQACKGCPSGNVAECGSQFATACTSNVCQEGSTGCLQELGIDGRMLASALFGSFSPGTTGALDLYEVAGGYATTEQNGVALGLLGGMEPGGTARDRCGPAATEPAPVTIPQSEFFQGNTRPDTGEKFDVAIGLHKSQLAQFAFAGYDGGLLCLTIGHSTVSQLTTDTLSLISRSLNDLNADGAAPMAVGLRPQAPPTITLGKNTFADNGSGGMKVVEPLLDLSFKAMEIDFFAEVDNQYIRTFTVVADVDLPIALQVSGMGQLVPVLGDVTNAFTNLSVKNSDAVTETPAALAAAFPAILNLVLPQLSSGLPAVSLPAIGPLNLDVTAITAVPTTHGGADNDFLAIFANLAVASASQPVHTTADFKDVYEPPAEQFANATTWKTARPPSITLALGGDKPSLEWSIKLDHGLWSAWSKSPVQTVTSQTLWLTGIHAIEVRAREIDQPNTMDTSTVSLELPLGPMQLPHGKQKFHGTSGASGCACNTNSGKDAAPFLFVFGFLMIPRRIRRKFGNVVTAAAIACLPGCSCDNAAKPCGDVACMDGAVAHGAIGRFTSVAGDDQRVLVATYDQKLGDLVVVDATDPTNLTNLVAVDGIPADVTPTHDPSTYRGGVEDAGPDVGAWTSIALANHTGYVAYQDRDGKALKLAYETSPGTWLNAVVDSPDGGEDVGSWTSLAVDNTGKPVIAYLATGVVGTDGHVNTELRLARATSATPGMGNWTLSKIVDGAGSCAGFCDAGTACAQPDSTMPPLCVAATTDCTATCSNSQVCHAGACIDTIADDQLIDIPTGSGLFPSLVVLSDGRLAVSFYDRNNRALMIAVETAAGSSTFTPTMLDQATPGDRGMWSSAVVDGSGTVHIAYQDALGDQLMYTTWNGTPGTPEVVDDGQRSGDRTHPVGASARIYLVGGAPSIAYQDALSADLVIATKSGGWQQTAFQTGPTLDGFSIGVTTGHGTPYIAWDQLTPANTPPNNLAVKTP